MGTKRRQTSAEENVGDWAWATQKQEPTERLATMSRAMTGRLGDAEFWLLMSSVTS